MRDELVTGIEPASACLQDRCSTNVSYTSRGRSAPLGSTSRSRQRPDIRNSIYRHGRAPFCVTIITVPDEGLEPPRPAV